MTVKQFMENYNIKNKTRVNQWISKGWIPGIKRDPKTNEIIIPDEARPPYTAARAKNTEAIYTSIVNACINRKHVFASLYKISEIEFNHYVTELENAGYIKSITIKGVTYYNATIKSSEFVKSKHSLQLIRMFYTDTVEAISKGSVSAAINQAL